MKENPNSQNERELGAVLRQWRLESPLPPRFVEQVWHRIEREQSAVAVPFWSWLAQWLRGAVARPALAVAYGATLLVMGVTGGVLQAHHQNARIDAMVQARYLQSIDPYQK